jgi:hypothetical protein
MMSGMLSSSLEVRKVQMHFISSTVQESTPDVPGISVALLNFVSNTRETSNV